MQAVDDAGRDGAGLALRESGKTSPRRLRVLEHVLAGSFDPRVRAIRPHLIEEDQAPDRARVLGAVAVAGLDPPALRILCRQDRRDRRLRHRRRPGLRHLGVVDRPVEELSEGQVADGRGRRVKKPWSRIVPQPVQPIEHHRTSIDSVRVERSCAVGSTPQDHCPIAANSARRNLHVSWLPYAAVCCPSLARLMRGRGHDYCQRRTSPDPIRLRAL